MLLLLLACQGEKTNTIRWNVAPNPNINIDLQNIQKLAQDISTLTSAPIDGVRLGVGISNGGAFAFTMGDILSFTAVTSLCGINQEAVSSQTQRLMCDNDTNEAVSGKRDQWEHGTNSLQERGIRTDCGLFPASPLYNERFTRFGAKASESQSVVEELRANETLDEDSFLILSPTNLGAVITDQPEKWLNFISFGDQYGLQKFKTEPKQTYADHGAFDDWTHRMIDFWMG